MAFFEVRFPVDVSYGSRGGPGYDTDVVIVKSGYEYRNANWTDARHVYNASYGIRDQEDMEKVIALFHVAQGKAHGFRYKDWLDYKSCGVSSAITATDTVVVSAATSGQTDFPLRKVYDSVGGSRAQQIFKPVASTVLLSVAASVGGVFTVYASSRYSVDYTTGSVTVVSALASGAAVRAGFEFDRPVRFDTDRLSVNLEEYLIRSSEIPLVELRVR